MNSMTFLFGKRRLQTMLWQHYARVNSHQSWKQTRFRVCFLLWCELTITMNVTEWQISWNSCYVMSWKGRGVNIEKKENHEKSLSWKKKKLYIERLKILVTRPWKVLKKAKIRCMIHSLHWHGPLFQISFDFPPISPKKHNLTLLMCNTCH